MGADLAELTAQAERDGDLSQDVTVVVSSELRALYRQFRLGRSADSAPVPDAPGPAGPPEPIAVPDAAPAPEPTAVGPDPEPVADHAPQGPGPAPDWEGVPLQACRLRCDGRRPVRFLGALMAEAAVDSWLPDGTRVRQSLALWRRSDGVATLHVTLASPDTEALMQIHRVTDCDSAEALLRALADYDPIEGFVDLPDRTAAGLEEACRAADDLRHDFHTLAGQVLGTRRLGQETDEDPLK